jgi:HEAT repeat protein
MMIHEDLRTMRLVVCLLPVAGLLLGCGGSAPRPSLPEMPPASAEVPDDTPAPAEAPVAVAEQVEQHREQLRSETDALARRDAAVALAQLGPEGWEELIRGLESESPEVRLASVQGLPAPLLAGEQGAAVRAILARLLRDADPQIRGEAALRLAMPGPGARSHMAALQQAAANDRDADVRRIAAESVVACQQTAGQVGALLRDRNPLIREQAILRLARFERDQVLALTPLLGELAKADPEESVRQAAEAALAAINSMDEPTAN